MRDLEILRKAYREMVGTVTGDSPRAVRVFTRHDVSPETVVQMLSLAVDTSRQVPIQDPVTGQIYCRAGMFGFEPVDAGVT